MNLRQPPALAVWLLERLGLTKQNEPLAGDLLEEFRSGRTAAWYWRQAFMAIATVLGQQLRFYRLDLWPLFVGWGAETLETYPPVWLCVVHVPLFLSILAWTLFVPSALMGVFRSPASSRRNTGSGKISWTFWHRVILVLRRTVDLFFFVAFVALIAFDRPSFTPVYLTVLYLFLILRIFRLFFDAVRLLRSHPVPSVAAQPREGDA